MILLLGGTSDTPPLAGALVTRGFSVLVSTMTDYPLKIGEHPLLSRHTGALDRDGLHRLILEHRICAIVNATHPYAERIGIFAERAAFDFDLPYARYVRPSCLLKEDFITTSESHTDAAAASVSIGEPVLLTIGSKNLLPYCRAAFAAEVPLVARILDTEFATAACSSCGIHPSHVIVGKGPFTFEDNLTHIKKFSIGVLVTKDSGKEGGVPEKVTAAKTTGCRVVVVCRPTIFAERVFGDLNEIVSYIVEAICPRNRL